MGLFTCFRKRWSVAAVCFIVCITVTLSCRSREARLPLLGTPLVSGTDTIYPTIAPFHLYDQDSMPVTHASMSGTVYVADFIFLSCPTICPKMTQAMYDIYETFTADQRIRLLSHTIDPARDSVQALKAYAEHMGVQSPRWRFLTGSQDTILSLANDSYFAIAYPDSNAPGGFAHSGALLLIDTNRHIRGAYNSLEPAELKRLKSDIQILLREQF